MMDAATFGFTQVDVFTEVALRGNPLAVVHDADALTDVQMQDFARWTNLSETTFLVRPTEPGADYRVRIFTPGGELPFAGHPTLGSCHAWIERGGRPRRGDEVVQQCTAGLVRIRLRDGRAAFAAPALRSGPVEPAVLAPALAALGLAPERVLGSQWLDNGPRWLGLLLDAPQTVLALEPDHQALKSVAKVGVVAAYPRGSECDYEVRAFASSIGVPEDPVTGSLNAGIAQWLIGSGRAPDSYVAAQGTRLGRAGRVSIERERGSGGAGDVIWVGGSSVSCVRGQVTI